jgi:hypothetical protein
MVGMGQAGDDPPKGKTAPATDAQDALCAKFNTCACPKGRGGHMFNYDQINNITRLVHVLYKRNIVLVEEDGQLYTKLPTHIEVKCGEKLHITSTWVEGDYTDQDPCNITIDNLDYHWDEAGYAVNEAVDEADLVAEAEEEI